MVGDRPTDPKYIFVAAPHTSNWDFLYGWLASQTMGMDVKIFAKDMYFFWPAKYVCAFLGVMPVNRRKSTNFVDSIAVQLDQADELALLIAPEGTRSYKPTLKSGYYHLAKKANVPIVVAGPNYAEKTFTLMPARPVMDTFEEDQAQVIEFIRSQQGYHPQNTFQ